MSAATWALAVVVALAGAALAAVGALNLDEATMHRRGRWILHAFVGVLILAVGVLVLVGAVLVGVWEG